jgi:glycosyltransferase involved in cell wall biosynthesis
VEIIVVDNHSSDNTCAIANDLADRVITAGPERSSQVNAGARLASGEYLYKIDSDFILQADVIREAVAAAQDQHLDGILIHNRSDPMAGRWARVRQFERDMYAGQNLNVAVRFVKLTLFLAIGGFDEALYAGEDYDLQARLVAAGARMGWITSFETHIGEPRTLREVVSKHFYYGSNLRVYVRKHGLHGVKQLSPLRLAFLRNFGRFLRHPVLFAEFLAYWGVKYAAGASGFLFGRSKPPYMYSSTIQ